MKLRGQRARLQWAAFKIRHRNVANVIEGVQQRKLSYLRRSALSDLARLAIKYETNKTAGAIIEAGCALGGSAIVLAAAKSKSRQEYVYDVFGMIPPPTEQDDRDVHDRYEKIVSGQSEGIGGDRYYGYEEDLQTKVEQNFSTMGFDSGPNNVHLVKGTYEDALHVNFPVCLAHIDCDWYQSVMTCLERIEPNLVRGGTLVIDDYNTWSGARKAVDEYFGSRGGYEFDNKSRLHIIKR
jgi:Macrocin-O-methyltransferase (TylF)